MANGYCVKCKTSREIKDAKQITMKNGRPATQGLCPVCGTKIFKIGGTAAPAGTTSQTDGASPSSPTKQTTQDATVPKAPAS